MFKNDFMNFEFNENNQKNLFLRRFKDLSPDDIQRYKEPIEIITERATKEFNIQKMLNKMREDWDPIQVEVKEFKDTGPNIVAGASVDEVN